MKNFSILMCLLFISVINYGLGQNSFHQVPGASPSSSSIAGLNPLHKSTGVRARFLIRASELTSTTPTALSAGDIVSLGFIWTVIPTNGSVENVTIRIAHSSDNDIVGGGHPIGGFKGEVFQDVFSGNITDIVAGQWVQIPFDSPFIWDGTSNILMEICKPNGVGATGGTIQTHTSTGGYNTRRSTTGSDGCTLTSGAFNYSTRPIFRFEKQGVIACAGTPTAGTASIVNDVAVCGSGSKSLALTGYATSESGIELQWQESDVAGGPYTDIAGADENTYTTPALSQTKYYVCKVTCANSGESAISNEVEVEINNPQILNTISDSECGFGQVTLEAEGTPGSTLRWFENPTGGNVLGTGNTFVTPTLSTTTTYYVEASSIVGPYSGGAKPTRGSTGTAQPNNHGLVFNSTSSFVLNTVDIYLASNSAGTLNVELWDGSNNVIQSGSFPLPAGNSSNPILYKMIPRNYTSKT